MKVLRWIAAHWKLPLIVVGALATWYLVTRKRRPDITPAAAVQRELQAVQAAAKISATQAEQGAAAARAEVEQTYAQQLAQLDETQKQQAAQLADDPAGLAKFLIKAAQ